MPVALIAAIAWTSGSAAASAQSVAVPCMTIEGDLSIVPGLPPIGDTDLWCEDPSDPRCSVGAARGAEAEAAHGSSASAGTLSSVAWPTPSVSDARFDVELRLPARAGVEHRIDRPPRHA